MVLNIDWSLFKVEMGLVALTFAALIFDLFLKDDPRRGIRLANLAMLGVALLIGVLCMDGIRLGSALKGTFVQDGLSFYFKLLFLLAGLFALFMAREYQGRLTRGQGEFTLLILFALTGMVFLATAADFLLFFVALETMTMSLIIMTAYLRDKNSSIEAGVKYLVLGALSTAVFLYGLSFIYGSTGSTSYGII